MKHAVENSAEVPCYVCGYDLRAHQDGRCPECGASVAESRRLAVYARRPAWAESDRRWRRRMMAGVWVLALLPAVHALRLSEWGSSLPVPDVFGRWGAFTTLGGTLFAQSYVCQPLIFCIGIVLLFSKERERRPGRLDWTRRWGVLVSYVIFLLCAAEVAFIMALVSLGIAALFLGLPLTNQPAFTLVLVHVSWFWMHYGPCPNEMAQVVLVAFSSIAVLLGCVPLFDALRSCGPRWLGASLVVPLALFSLLHIGQAGWQYLGAYVGYPPAGDLGDWRLYFATGLLLEPLAEAWELDRIFLMEATKWSAVLVTTLWLSTASVAARRGKMRA